MAFCVEIHATINFTGQGFLQVFGDDDIFVFLDKKLMIDYGGTHPAVGKTIMLEDRGLLEGVNYPLDFFMCERKSAGSSLNFSTNANIFCSRYDQCGICNGNGQSCCKNNTPDCPCCPPGFYDNGWDSECVGIYLF